MAKYLKMLSLRYFYNWTRLIPHNYGRFLFVPIFFNEPINETGVGVGLALTHRTKLLY